MEIIMFRDSDLVFKTKQMELYKQAEHYRLVKSLRTPKPITSQLLSVIGQVLIQFGQVLINRTQAAY
jgi:hypothetical protein